MESLVFHTFQLKPITHSGLLLRGLCQLLITPLIGPSPTNATHSHGFICHPPPQRINLRKIGFLFSLHGIYPRIFSLLLLIFTAFYFMIACLHEHNLGLFTKRWRQIWKFKSLNLVNFCSRRHHPPLFPLPLLILFRNLHRELNRRPTFPHEVSSQRRSSLPCKVYFSFSCEKA